MSDKAITVAIQKDWKEREMIEIVHLNILKVSLPPRVRSSSSALAVPVLFLVPRVLTEQSLGGAYGVPPRRRQHCSWFHRHLPVLQSYQGKVPRVRKLQT